MKKQPEQPRLIAEQGDPNQASPEEEKQKEVYRQRLKEALQDPEFRKMPGFPIGTDEAILELSDPPYYTACPNPFINEIIAQWQAERQEIRQQLGLPDDTVEGNGYHREPFAIDVSEGRSGTIYNAHSYHTKVPYEAIMRYLLHYTEPGDIIFDGFCGTGMTGVASEMCGKKKEIKKLGYQINNLSEVFYDGVKKSHYGVRKAVQIDLSSIATFISYNYNIPVKIEEFKKAVNEIIKQVKIETDWMYDTWHDSKNSQKGRINYIIWSDVYICPNCGVDNIFWDVAINQDRGIVNKTWNCPKCGVLLTKNHRGNKSAIVAEKYFIKEYDEITGKIHKKAKLIPVLIEYTFNKKRYRKRPDNYDFELLEEIKKKPINKFIPIKKIPDGINTRQPLVSHGIEYVHQFYSHRNLIVLASIYEAINEKKYSNQLKNHLLFLISSYNLTHSTIMTRIIFKSGGKKPILTSHQTGTLYISSLPVEKNIIRGISELKINTIEKSFNIISEYNSIISTQSSTNLNFIPDNSFDYIFIDPPFGGNLMYSELNIIWESWLKIFTNNDQEAIINMIQEKNLQSYSILMEECFKNFFRTLKPDRWITIEFHNSQNAVWNSIQEALLRAGFMVADVRILDKKQGSFKQVTTQSAVKKDLVISAYKPSLFFENIFLNEHDSLKGVWVFVTHHLSKLPLPNLKNYILQPIQERYSYLLYDRMVAFHIQRGLTVPLSATTFYQGLEKRFVERDGMYFLSEQIPHYDKMRLNAKDTYQIQSFVIDEKTSLQWIRQQLDTKLGGKEQSFADIQPQFLMKLKQAKHEQLPELIELLEQNFLQRENGKWYVPDPNKASDLEKLRNKALLREFAHYLKENKRLRQFRSEAVRAGFADAWQRKDFQTIVQVAERLPEQVLQEDPDLLMYYDNASLRID